jgi:predicted 3-demethylubiquinone-9 3-methyltransferase (glyoxalase superfamily)
LQIVPTALPRLLAHEDPLVAGRVFAAMSAMVKIDIAGLERAAKGHS